MTATVTFADPVGTKVSTSEVSRTGHLNRPTDADPAPQRPRAKIVDLARCSWCTRGHRKSNWIGRRELRCHDCGRRMPHSSVMLNEVAAELNWLINLFFAAKINPGITAQDKAVKIWGRRTVKGTSTGTPKFTVHLADDLTPWGMLEGLKATWKILGDARTWNTDWYPSSDDAASEHVSWQWAARKTERVTEGLPFLDEWDAKDPWPWINRWRNN